MVMVQEEKCILEVWALLGSMVKNIGEMIKF
jgi:hypothetical protein